MNLESALWRAWILVHGSISAHCDALGCLTFVTKALAGVTAYTYDARDNLRTVTDTNQRTRTVTYDWVNRVRTEARPLGETITYDYDEVGNLQKRRPPL